MSKNLISVPPELEDQLRLTWLKRDIAEYAAESFHEDLLSLRGGDDQAFKSAIALYAGWAQYATALNNQLDQMNGGQPFTDEPVALHYPSNKELEKLAEAELNSEGDAFVNQWKAILLPARDSWVQRVQASAADAQSTLLPASHNSK
jgi:hypothetical protein